MVSSPAHGTACSMGVALAAGPGQDVVRRIVPQREERGHRWGDRAGASARADTVLHGPPAIHATRSGWSRYPDQACKGMGLPGVVAANAAPRTVDDGVVCGGPPFGLSWSTCLSGSRASRVLGTASVMIASGCPPCGISFQLSDLDGNRRSPTQTNQLSSRLGMSTVNSNPKTMKRHRSPDGSPTGPGSVRTPIIP